ncbi:hypothetical protein QR680_016420 [Steinernema hermaphroditum]|uniref:Uncharacterized protein n=1 Tax=Steinernema hermaphroditum TaxID=289476 RepID=A0AA39LMM1_9BILA|nr:hypothetical protein QR680_016420 [Steinernema hermaphroditum]
MSVNDVNVFFYYLFAVLALLFGFFFIYIVLRNSPPSLRVYRNTILNLTFWILNAITVYMVYHKRRTKNVWPSNSPDLNPLDYAIWGIMEQKACAIKHKSIDSLKRALEKAWEEITPEMIAAILTNFRKRLDACIAAEGSHFECD